MSNSTRTSSAVLAHQEDDGRAPPGALAGGTSLDSNPVSLLAHDIRSAMADVIGGLRLIDAEELDAQTRAQFDRVRSSGEMLARLLEGVLSGMQDKDLLASSHASNLNLGRFLHDLESRWTGRAIAGNKILKLSIAPDLPAILSIDRVALDRVLGNLIGNALKFAGKRGVQLQVDRTADDTLRFRICDDGPGFSDAALDHLFEFAGRPEGSNTPGTGMGLFIAKHLADGLGGRLSVRNLTSGGAMSSLCLPRESWQPQPESETPEGLPDLTGLKVLVAEDNETNQLLTGQMLEALGAEYEIAADGIEALRWLDREDFDLALIDIEMPRLNGIDVMRAIRQGSGATARMPLVALTAYVLKSNRDSIYAAGADGIIAKPIMDIAGFSAALRSFSKDRSDPVSAPTMPGPKPALNPGRLEELLKIAGPEQAAELLDRLEADLSKAAESLGSACESGDADEARAASHVLISLAGAIGADDLHGLARTLNAAAHARDLEHLARLGPMTVKLISAVQAPIVELRRTLAVPQ